MRDALGAFSVITGKVVVSPDATSLSSVGAFLTEAKQVAEENERGKRLSVGAQELVRWGENKCPNPTETCIRAVSCPCSGGSFKDYLDQKKGFYDAILVSQSEVEDQSVLSQLAQQMNNLLGGSDLGSLLKSSDVDAQIALLEKKLEAADEEISELAETEQLHKGDSTV